MKTADELYEYQLNGHGPWPGIDRESFVAGYDACMAQTFEHINRLQKALTKAIQQRDAEYSWMWSAYTRKELDEQIEEILSGNVK